MIILVDISKSQKREEKIKVNANNIVSIFPAKREPGKKLIKEFADTLFLVNCCSSEEAKSLIAVAVNDNLFYYKSPLSAEEINKRINKAEADAMITIQRRFNKE